MRLLVAHNHYLHPGGEDTVFRSEVSLLRKNGHDVLEYVESNERIKAMTPIELAVQTIWSAPSYRAVKGILDTHKPEIVHFHNFFPLISPSAYYACHEAGVPVIQSLHNPRLICPAATFYRERKLCTDCLGKFAPWPGIVHACYRNSRLQTAGVTSMLTFHRLIKTWQKMVTAYVVFTDFYRRIFIEGGLPPEKLLVKPHFVDRRMDVKKDPASAPYALFVGRLDPEKGIMTLLEAWKNLSIPLKLRASGRLEDYVRNFIRDNNMTNVELIGRLSESDLARLAGNARFLVVPSEGYYETFGMVIIESYSLGVPVLTSNIGVLSELVSDGRTGLHFRAGDPKDMASKAQLLWNNHAESRKMGQMALKEFEAKYTPEINYRQIMKIYKHAISVKSNA